MKHLLKDFQRAIKDEALWIYGMPYSKLPRDTQVAIRKQVLETYKQKIFELTTDS